MKTMILAMCLQAAAASYPTVVAHGMGDSCFNDGMKGITEIIANTTGDYAACIPTGKNKARDTDNGFFMTMNKNVDVFAANIKKDPNLANATFINCAGFSQGNSLCRGYIHKYNDPPVANFLSVHGTVSGVAGFPNCNPAGLLGPVSSKDTSQTHFLECLLSTFAYFFPSFEILH
jgi:palmitoyl-protein thioesterase